ncbi:uncharacterized protein FMAN_10681 [Fusarium mangiferae]|uniref:Uncharacterized protein n=1 Tax=Fusarium mangiferae TaxID=192010 RepID=A0A1L7U451_FUSMA|nr:uncharacterized protein FMAN_10681 [Fusarium mangiferae]CVL05540.1 uncharacterized protein FMAN_10681 [Fusarium mangiferae]
MPNAALCPRLCGSVALGILCCLCGGGGLTPCPAGESPEPFVARFMAKIKVRRRFAKDAKANDEHGLSVSNECARICNAFVGSVPESSTDNQIAGAFGNMALQQDPRGVDRGRHQSFFALNAPQGNPFAAAGAASIPFPTSLQQQPFTGQHFGLPGTSNSLERVCKNIRSLYSPKLPAVLHWAAVWSPRRVEHPGTHEPKRLRKV